MSTIISYKFEATASSFISTVTQIESRLNSLQKSAPTTGKMVDGAFGTGKGADALVKDVQRAESALQGLHASASKVGSAIQGVFMGIGGALATKGLEAVGGAFGAVKGAVVDMNATLETSKISWGVLLGSTDAAEKKLGELYDFAAKTPFDFPGVEKASRLLQTFGGDALNTADNMTMIGDIASGVGQPFEEVAMWTGRMYDAMQSGKPFGESAARLQEMGAMSGATRTRLEEMQKAGVSGAEMWATFGNEMGRFGGMMEKQSTSFSGRMATMSDTLTQLAATAGKPIFDLMSNALGVLLDENHLGSPKVAEFATALSTQLAGGITKAISWIGQLASGFLDFGKQATAALGGFGEMLRQYVLDPISFMLGLDPGAWGTGFSEVFNQIIATAGAFGDKVGRVMSLVHDGVVTVKQALSGEWVSDASIQPVVRFFGETALRIRNEVIPALLDFGKRLMDAAQSFAAVFTPERVAILQQFARDLTGASQETSTLGIAFKVLSTVLPPTVDAMGKLVGILIDGLGWLQKTGHEADVLRLALGGIGAWIALGQLISLGKQLADVAMQAKAAADNLLSVPKTIISTVKTVYEKAGEAAQTGGDIARTVLTTIKTAWGTAQDAVIWAQLYGEQAKGAITKTVSAVWDRIPEPQWPEMKPPALKLAWEIPTPTLPTLTMPTLKPTWDIPMPTLPTIAMPTLKPTWDIPIPTLPEINPPTIKPQIDLNLDFGKIATGFASGLAGAIGGALVGGEVIAAVTAGLAAVFASPLLIPAIGIALAALAIGAFALFVKSWSDQYPSFGAAMGDLFGNIIPTALGAAAAGIVNAGMFLIDKILEGITTAAPKIFQFIEANWSALLVAAIIVAFGPLAGIVAALLGQIVPIVLAKGQEITTAIGTAFSTIGTTVSGALSTIVSTVGSTFSTIGTTISTAMSTIGSTVGDAFSNIGTIIQGALDTARNIVTSAWDNIIGILATAKDRIVQAIQDAFQPVGQIISALMSGDWAGAIRAGLDLLYNVFVDLPGKLLQIVGDAFRGVLGVITSTGQDIATLAKTTWDNVTSTIGTALSTVGTTVGTAFSTIGTTISTAMETIKTTIQGAWDTITSAIGTAWSSIGTAVTTGIDAIITKAGAFKDQVVGVFQAAWDAVTSAVGTFFQAFGTSFANHLDQDLLGKITAWKTSAVDAFTQFTTAVTSTFTGWWDSVSNGFTTFTTNLTTKAGEIKTGITTAITDMATAATTAFTNWFTSVVTDVGQFVSNVGTKVGELKTSVTTAITDMATSAATAFTNWFTSVTTDVGQFVSNVGTKVGELKTSVTTAIGDMATSATTAFTNWFSSVVSDITEFVSNVGTKIGGLKDSVVNGVKEMATSATTSFTDWFTSTVTSVAQFVTDVGTKIGNLKDTVVKGVKDMATNSMTEFTTWVTNVVTKVGDLGSSVATKMREIGGGITSAILAPFEAVATGIPKALAGIGGFVGSALKGVETVLNNFGSGVVGVINGIGSKFKAPALTWNHIAIPGLQTGHGNFQGGAAVVGEKGPELGIVNGKTTMLGAHGPELTTLPKSAIVLPAHVTKSLLASGVPGFETGLNLNALSSFFTGAPDKIIQMALDAAGIKGPQLPGEIATMAPAIMTTVKDWMIGWLKDFLKTALPVAPEQLQRGIQFAEAQVGKPYIWGGGHGNWSDINAPGWDCSGFVSAVLHSMGIDNPNGIVTDFYNWMAQGRTGVVDIGTNNATNPDPTIQHMGMALMGQQYESGGPFGGVGKNGTNFADWGHPPGGVLDTAKGGGDPAQLSWNNILAGKVQGQWSGPESVPPMGTLFDMMEAKPALFTEQNVMRIADTLPRFANGGVITDPTIGLIGEGGKTEIVTPEPLLRSIVRDESGRGFSGSGMTASIQPIIGDTGRMLAGPGKDLLSGFMRGAQQQMPKVEKFFTDLTDSIPDWKGPQSRDLLLLYASGQWVIEGFVNGMDSKILDVAKKAADVSQSVSKAIMDGVQALGALRTLVLPGGEQTSAFFTGLNTLVQGFVDSANSFETDGLKAGVVYAEAAGKIVSMVKTGTEALAALVNFVRPTDQAIGDFKFAVEKLVVSFAESAQVMDVQFMAGAVIFSEAASASVAVVKDGVDALTKLTTFVRPSDKAIGDFKFAVEKLVQSFGDSAALMDPAVLEHAKTFSDAAGKAVAILDTGVKGLSALSDFKRPSDQAIGDFKFAVELLVRSLGDSAALMDASFTTHAGTFAEAAGKAVGILDTGVKGLSALSDFRRPSDQAIGDFKAAIESLVRALGDSAALMDPTFLQHATSFTDTAGKAIGILGAGVDGLTKLSGFKRPSDQAIGDFKVAVEGLVRALGDSAAIMDPGFLTHANTFNDAATKAIGILGVGIAGLTKLNTFTAPGPAAIAAFKVSVEGLVQALGDSAQLMTNDFMAHATAFSGAATSALGILTTGVTGLRSLSDFATPNRTAIDAFLTSTTYIVDQLGKASDGMNKDGIAKIQAFATAATTALGLAKGAGDAFAAIANSTPPSTAAMDIFLAAAMYIVDKIAQAATRMETDGIARFQAFSTAATTSLGAAKAAGDAFSAIASTTPPSTAAIDVFLAAAMYIVDKIAESANRMETDGIARIQAFATAAVTSLGAAKAAGDAFIAMANSTPPSREAIDQFLAAAMYIVQRLDETAQKMTTEGIAKVQAFANAANTCLTVAKTGTEAFKGMAELKAPSAQAIDQLLSAINYVVQKIDETAQHMSTEGIAKIQQFAKSAGECLDVTKKGVDAFKGMAELKEPSRQAIDTLVAAIVYVVQKLDEVANNIGTEGINKAKNFARDLVGIYNDIKTAVTEYEQMKQLDGHLTQTMDTIARDTAGALEKARAAETDSRMIKDSANYFLGNMREAQQKFNEAESVRNSINTNPAPPPSLSASAAPSAPSGISPAAQAAADQINLPHLAAGGLVTRPTIALVGESGPELVIPAKHFRRDAIRPLSGLARMGGEGGTIVNLDAPITIYTQSGDPAEIDRAVRRGLRRAVGELQAGV